MSAVVFPSLRRLKAKEKLLIWRKRLKLTQGQAGTRFGCSAWQYGQMERGEVPALPYVWRGPFELKGHEFCILSRLRSGKTQEEVGRELGVSRIWICTMETGQFNADRLIKYWGSSDVWES